MLEENQEEEIQLMSIDFAVLALLWALDTPFGIVVELFPNLHSMLRRGNVSYRVI